jgi:hypothetical protein
MKRYSNSDIKYFTKKNLLKKKLNVLQNEKIKFFDFSKKKVKENENEKLIIEKVQTTCIKKNQTLS